MFTFRTILILLFLSCCANINAQNIDINLQTNHNLFSSYSHGNIDDTTYQFVDIPFNKHSFSNIGAQALVGSLCAFGFAALPFSSISSNSGSKEQPNSAAVIVTLASYAFGAAIGVHWIAQFENPQNSFWGTAASSIIGVGIGTGLLFIQSSDSYFIGLIAVLSPIIGSIIYTSFIAEWPNKTQNISLYQKYFSHKDLVEQSKFFNAELFRLNF